MSESRFSVDDILKEVEMMRKKSSESAERKSGIVKESVDRRPAPNIAAPAAQTPEAVRERTVVKPEQPAGSVHTVEFELKMPDNSEQAQPVRHAAPQQQPSYAPPEDNGAQKLSDFLSKTSDTGYTPGKSEEAKSRIDRLYDGESDVVVDPLKKARRQYNPNVLTPEEINSATVVMPAVKNERPRADQKTSRTELQEEPAPDYDEIDDYYTMRDADDIRREFKSRLNGVSVRMALTLILSLLSGALTLLPIAGIGLPEIIGSGYGLLAAHGILLLLAVIVNFMSVIRGFFSALILKAQIDSPSAIATAAAAAQIIYLCFIPSQADNTLIYAPAAVFALFCGLCGKRVLLSRVLKNFRLVATADAKQNGFVLSDEESDKIADSTLGDPVVCCQKSVINLHGYMHNALCEDPADTVSRVISPLSLAIAAIAGIIAWMMTENMTTVFCVIAAFAAVAAPVANLISTSLPLATLSRSLREMGAMVSGYNAVSEFSAVNAAVLSDEDLFPSGSIEMVSVKACGGRKINEVMMYAAALCVNAGGAFSDVFDRLIEGRRDELPETRSVVCRDGEGISGTVDGLSVKVGTRELMKKDGCINLPDGEFEQKMLRQGNFPYYISIDGELCGICLLRHNNIVDTDNIRYIRRMIKAGVELYIRTNDPYITPKLIKDLFGISFKSVHILNSMQKEIYDKATRPSENGDSLISNKNSAAAFACSVAGCKRARMRIIYGVFIQIVFVVIGLAATAYFMLTGNSEYTAAWCVLAYQAASMLGVSLIPRLFSLK